MSELTKEIIKDVVDRLIKESKILNQEDINNLISKNYYSGREIKVGEQILFGLITENENVKLISLHVDEISNIYEIDENKIINKDKNLLFLTKI